MNMKKIEVSCVEIKVEQTAELALCPLCGKNIMTDDAIVIGVAHSVLSLCHSLCVFEQV